MAYAIFLYAVSFLYSDNFIDCQQIAYDYATEMKIAIM